MMSEYEYVMKEKQSKQYWKELEREFNEWKRKQ